MVMRLMFIRNIYYIQQGNLFSNKHTQKVVEECVGIFFFSFLFLHHLLPPRRRFRDYAALKGRINTAESSTLASASSQYISIGND
jgi:hypothetical protein